MTRLAQVGLGQWGKNLARNFDRLAELVWLCDIDDERRAEAAQAYRSAQATSSFDDVLALGNTFLSRGVEDVVFCYLRFPSGKMAHMHLSWLDPHKIRRITVVGNERMAVFDDMERERKITVYDNWRTRTGDVYSPTVDATEPLRP